MLGREPRLPHHVMRWLIIALLLINGVQLVLLQGTINATLSREFSQTWVYVGLSAVALLLSCGLLAFAFARSRRSKDG
jgi:ABC-type transport system involved in multi-copper enzyme maturation permease subunit